MNRLCCVVVFGLSFVVSHAMAATPSLLLLPFENATGKIENKPLEKGMPDLVVAFLAGQSELAIVEREQLEAVMAEHGLKWENVTTRAPDQIGRLLQARYVIRGSLLPVGKNLQTQVFLYDTESTRLLKSWQADAKRPPEAQARELAEKIATFFQTDLPSLPPLRPESDPETQRMLIAGLGYFHTGQYEKAIAEFMKTLERTPHHSDAHYWLVRSYQKAEMDDHATAEANQFKKNHPKDPRVREFKP